VERDLPCGPIGVYAQFGIRHLGEPPEVIKGASVDVLQFEEECRWEAAWRVQRESGWDFQAIIVAQPGEVFPLPSGLVRVTDCHPMLLKSARGPLPASAELFVDPLALKWFALAPDSAFIPFGGEATLDRGWYAKAEIETSDAGGADPSVKIFIWMSRIVSGEGSASVHEGLRTGDTFGWGRALARIVRIVPIHTSDSGVVGWVEVALSAIGRADSGG
jgi:hypothetical protein